VKNPRLSSSINLKSDRLLERGKPTLQLQKVLDTLDLMGLEVVVQRKNPFNRWYKISRH